MALEPGFFPAQPQGCSMPAIKVRRAKFSGASKVYDVGPEGLTAIVRGLAIDNARLAVAVSAVIDFTDNSTGTAGSTVADIPVIATIDSSSLSVGAPRAALNTALGVVDNAMAVVAENMNIARTRLGLPVLTYTGTVATPGTIPAMTKTLTATTGALCATYASSVTAFDKAEANLKKLAYAMNEVLTAIGVTPVTIGILGNIPVSAALVASGSTALSADGADAASDASVDAALTALANGVAKLAAVYNAAFAGASTATTPLNVIAG